MTTSVHNQCTSWCGGSGSNLMKSRHWVSMNASVIRENKKKKQQKKLFSVDCYSGTSSKHRPSIDSTPREAATCFRAVVFVAAPSGGTSLSGSRESSRCLEKQWADHRGGIDLSSHSIEAARQLWITGPLVLSGVAQARRGWRWRSARAAAAHSRASICYPQISCFTRRALNFAQIGKRRGELKEWP